MKKPHHAKTAVIQCQLGTYLFMQALHGETRKMAEFVYQNLLFDVFFVYFKVNDFCHVVDFKIFFPSVFRPIFQVLSN